MPSCELRSTCSQSAGAAVSLASPARAMQLVAASGCTLCGDMACSVAMDGRASCSSGQQPPSPPSLPLRATYAREVRQSTTEATTWRTRPPDPGEDVGSATACNTWEEEEAAFFRAAADGSPNAIASTVSDMGAVASRRGSPPPPGAPDVVVRTRKACGGAPSAPQ